MHLPGVISACHFSPVSMEHLNIPSLSSIYVLFLSLFCFFPIFVGTWVDLSGAVCALTWPKGSAWQIWKRCIKQRRKIIGRLERSKWRPIPQWGSRSFPKNGCKSYSDRVPECFFFQLCPRNRFFKEESMSHRSQGLNDAPQHEDPKEELSEEVRVKQARVCRWVIQQ